MAKEIMNFNFEKKSEIYINVIGVGGGGSNAVNHMYSEGIKGVGFIVCNTDAQALKNSPVPKCIQLGTSLTEGRGAGNKPEIGRKAALENIEDVKRAIDSSTRMVFITAGMGGGTGTGAAPVIAAACREKGVLTVGIVTIPFQNEGRRRVNQAIEGISELDKYVDALLVINNERIREMYGDLRLSEAFARADNVLTMAAKGIAEIITVPGYINVDFADVETVMKDSGVALMGSATISGENRALRAVEEALHSPLLNNNDINGAQNILLNVISGAEEVTMDEINAITGFIQAKAGHNADLIWGNRTDNKLKDELSVTIIATGYNMSCIPEMMSGKIPDKTYHSLDGEVVLPQDIKKPAPVVKESSATVTVQEKSATTIEFDVEDATSGDNIYAQPSSKNEPSMRIDFSKSNDNVVENLENTPAFQRRNFNVTGNTKQSGGRLSKFSLSADDDDNIVLRDNNSFLHDKAD